MNGMGGFAEYPPLPAFNVCLCTDDIPDEFGAILDPLGMRAYGAQLRICGRENVRYRRRPIGSGACGGAPIVGAPNGVNHLTSTRAGWSWRSMSCPAVRTVDLGKNPEKGKKKKDLRPAWNRQLGTKQGFDVS